MQIYGMDHAALEEVLQTNLTNGLDSSTQKGSNKSTAKYKISFKEYTLFLKEKFYFIDIIVLISYLIAGIFSVLNHNSTVLFWTIISLLASVLIYLAGCFAILYYKKRFLARIKERIPAVEVIRSGKECLISPNELKKGDVILLMPGILLYGDARIIECDHLLADESTVFSATVSSEKTDEILLDDGILPENQKNMLWKGSAIAEGTGKAVIVALDGECYIEKTGSRKEKQQRSFFYNRQHNIGQIFCYFFLLLVALNLLIAVFVSARIIDAFLIMGLLLSVIIINPIAALTEWTYYRTAERLVKEGVIIRNIEAFDRIDQEKNLYFECKKIVSKHLALKEIVSLCGTDEENTLYYSLCKDTDSLGDPKSIEAARNQYPVLLKHQDDCGNLFSVFAKGGKSVLIAIGYWQKMLPYVSSFEEETKALISEIESAGSMVYLMATYSFNYIPNRLETETLLGNMNLIAMPVYSADLGTEMKERLAQFKRLHLNSILISDYSPEFNDALMRNYGFSELQMEHVGKGEYSIAALNQMEPVVYGNSAPIFCEQAQIVVNENVPLWDLVYKIKCMFCGIKRCFNFLLLYLCLGVISVLPMFLYEHSVLEMIIPLISLPVIALYPCYFLVESVKNCTQSRKSFLLGTFCGLFSLICAISNHASALFTLEFSAVLLSFYLALIHWKSNGIKRREAVCLLLAVLLSVGSLAFASGGWLVAIFLSVLSTLCALILDRFY